jgi:hypothetical protein
MIGLSVWILSSPGMLFIVRLSILDFDLPKALLFLGTNLLPLTFKQKSDLLCFFPLLFLRGGFLDFNFFGTLPKASIVFYNNIWINLTWVN